MKVTSASRPLKGSSPITTAPVASRARTGPSPETVDLIAQFLPLPRVFRSVTKRLASLTKFVHAGQMLVSHSSDLVCPTTQTGSPVEDRSIPYKWQQVS